MASNADPSPQYIETDERASVLEMLAHVHEFSQLVVLLTGPVGCGRTLLLNRLSEQLGVHYQTLCFSAVELSNLDDIHYEIALQLGCAAHPAEIEQSLSAMSQQNESFHILVDDAHLLSDEALTYLMAHSQGEHRWHLMLAGDSVLMSLADRVQQNLQCEGMLHSVELQPLSEEATTQFLQGFYKQAGIEQLPLSDKALHHYWRLSGGLPGQLVSIVDAQPDVKSQVSSKIPIGHVAAVVLIGSALLVSYLYKAPEATVKEDDAIARLIAGEAVVTEVVDSELAASNPNLPEASTDATNGESDELANPIPENSPLSDKDAQLTPSQEETLVEAPQTFEKQSLDDITEHPLLSARPTDFGLQLVGVRNKQSAQAVVDQFGPQLGENKLSIYTTQFKGQPWYVVVYAPIEGKDSATKTANQLSKLMSTQPWVRPMEKIQEDIRKNDQVTD